MIEIEGDFTVRPHYQSADSKTTPALIFDRRNIADQDIPNHKKQILYNLNYSQTAKITRRLAGIRPLANAETQCQKNK